MPEHIRVLIYLIVISLAVFQLSQKSFNNTFKDGELVRWRNTWITLTTIGIFAGNFWVFIIASGLVLLYTLKNTDDRLSFFLVCALVIPPFTERIPGLFEISYTRMLILLAFLPVLLSKKMRLNTPALGKPLADKLLVAFIILFSLLAMRGTTPGDALRLGFTLSIDWFMPYFAASRMIKNFDHLKKVLIALLIGGSIVGVIGIFENVKGRMLYGEMATQLHVTSLGGNGLLRGDELRAIATLGHPLALGFIMMLIFGLFLFLGSLIKTKKWRWLFFLIVCAALYAPVSRGPWSGAFVIFLVYISTGKKVIKNLTLLFFTFLIIVPILPGLPGGQKIIKLIPFFGTAEQFNVDYRKELVPRAISILKRNPLFGVYESSLEPEMSDMLQGEGIVDIVNSYLNIALATGMVGFSLFIWFFLSILFRLRKSMRYIKDKSREEYACGRILLAAMLGIFVTISTNSFLGTLTSYMYIVAGIMLSYSRIINTKQYKDNAISS